MGGTLDKTTRHSGWTSSGWERKPRMTHAVQTEGPHIDGTDYRRQAPLPCGSQQLKRGHKVAEVDRGVRGEKLGEQRVKEGENVVILNPADRG